jgi:GNAT superfamily N-acetyltransferase
LISPVDREHVFDGATEAVYRAQMSVLSLIPGSAVEVNDGGIERFICPVPIATMSGLYVPVNARGLDQLASLAQEFVARGAPWSIISAGAVPEAVRESASALGFRGSAVPTLAVQIGSRTSSASVRIENYRRVKSEEDARAWATISDEAFALPAGTSAALVSPGVLASPFTRFFLALEDQIPVAAACAVVQPGGWLGVFNVGTLALARRQGIGERLVRFVLDDGAGMGATRAVLESSDMARSLYERIGFRDVMDDLTVFQGSADQP